MVIGIDFSERMIAIARGLYPEIDFRVDDCAALRTIADEHVDLVIANDVLMDTPDLHGTMAAFHRVLTPGGTAVLVSSHPCFPQEQATVSADGDEISDRWHFPYFKPRTCLDPPWAHFTSEFTWFHRPRFCRRPEPDAASAVRRRRAYTSPGWFGKSHADGIAGHFTGEVPVQKIRTGVGSCDTT
jgi:SAM-dependent methyltransferase